MDQACSQAGVDASLLPCVHASAMGDMAITDAMCRTLAIDCQAVSPTRFHNSVLNAPVGYWSIATGGHLPADAISAFDGSCAAALLQAAIAVAVRQQPVLTVAQDVAVTDNCLQSGTCTTDPDLTYGWKLLLEDGGEKALASPLTVAGIAFFTSYIPSTSSTTPCQPSEGSGRLYALSLQDATSVINYDTTDDDPDDEEGVATTTSDRYRDIRAPGIPPEIVALPGIGTGFNFADSGGDIESVEAVTRWRTFWFLGEDTDL
jgi:hypothetical protein